MVTRAASGKRQFASLSAQEVLALAISLEEDDARLYQDFARALWKSHPDCAAQIEEKPLSLAART